MLTAEEFFDLSRFRHADIFAMRKPAWAAIGKIKENARRIVASFEAREPGRARGAGNRSCRPAKGTGTRTSDGLFSLAALARKGQVVARTTVIHAGKMLVSGFRLEPGDVTRGEFKVFARGRRLQNASVVFAGASLFDEEIVIGEGTVVEPGALVKGPTLIGCRCDVRQGAYVRGGCVFGDGCVIGHATEVKDSLFLNGAKAGHFTYIGDSILGNNVNLGAGTKLANLKIVDSPVRLRIGGQVYNTGLRKFGAIIGDGGELGCNSVTSPGTLLGKRCLVYPCVSVPAGYYLERSILGHARDATTLRRVPLG